MKALSGAALLVGRACETSRQDAIYNHTEKCSVRILKSLSRSFGCSNATFLLNWPWKDAIDTRCGVLGCVVSYLESGTTIPVICYAPESPGSQYTCLTALICFFLGPEDTSVFGSLAQCVCCHRWASACGFLLTVKPPTKVTKLDSFYEEYHPAAFNRGVCVQLEWGGATRCASWTWGYGRGTFDLSEANNSWKPWRQPRRPSSSGVASPLRYWLVSRNGGNFQRYWGKKQKERKRKTC